MAKTNFKTKCEILGGLWIDYRDDENFADFIEYNDLGLPLAFAYANGIIDDLSAKATEFINEAFDLLLSGFGQIDIGYTSLQELIADIELIMSDD